jgi:hypothetical protein
LKEVRGALKILGVNSAKYMFAWWGGDFGAISYTEVTIVGGFDEGDIIQVKKVTA